MSISSEFLTMLGVQDDFCIQLKEYTNLLVFIVQLGRCNNSYIVHYAPAARLESGRKSRAIRYILFCQSPYRILAYPRPGAEETVPCSSRVSSMEEITSTVNPVRSHSTSTGAGSKPRLSSNSLYSGSGGRSRPVSPRAPPAVSATASPLGLAAVTAGGARATE
ncbi:MAG: hypothetical protein BECKG1743D_GA0114223_100772 [Candidatus Kentron sp. G]|nr:MAG: hypothetical protein BECKG1743D_GA0114223_100772 [Candidatus Kentron sp. G]